MTTIQTTIQIPDNSIGGNALSAIAEIQPTQLAQRVLMNIPVALSSVKTWDNMAVNLPPTPATDDLGLITGTPGTNAPKLSTGDVKALGPTTRKGAFELAVPANYDDGQTIQIVLRTAMETTIADVSATVDVEVFKPDGTGAVGSDLCSTAAVTINSLTPGNKTFTIDAAGVDPGDKLIVVVSVAVNDAATGTAVTGVVYGVDLKCDTRG